MNKSKEVKCPKCLKYRTIITSINTTEKCCLSCSKKVDRNIVNYFNIIDNPKKAYILGYLWADGWLNKNIMAISLKSSDLEVLEFMKDEMKAGTISHRIRNNPRFLKPTHSSTFVINSNFLVRKIKELDFRNSLNYVKSEYYLDFLRGFLDGDGCISYNKKSMTLSISFSSNKNENWNHIITILDFYNINYTISRNKTCSNLHIIGSDKVKIELLDKLYDTNFFFLKRKQIKYLDYKSFKNERWKSEDRGNYKVIINNDEIIYNNIRKTDLRKLLNTSGKTINRLLLNEKLSRRKDLKIYKIDE